jgi:hypothetical protein
MIVISAPLNFGILQEVASETCVHCSKQEGSSVRKQDYPCTSRLTLSLARGLQSQHTTHTTQTNMYIHMHAHTHTSTRTHAQSSSDARRTRKPRTLARSSRSRAARMEYTLQALKSLLVGGRASTSNSRKFIGMHRNLASEKTDCTYRGSFSESDLGHHFSTLML